MSKLSLRYVIFIMGLMACAQGYSETLRHCITGGDAYTVNLLKLALSYSGKKYDIEKMDATCSQSRQIEFVYSGKLDFMWAATTKELEERLIPIRVPLFKGLLGHRLLIIRGGDQHRFSSVDSLAELQSMKLGQGRTWADTFILESAGMKVVKSNGYANLFYMLEGGRFDAFPRGANEPWGEVKQRPELGLTVEKSLALVYPMPAYIFVSPERPELAKALREGFDQAIADGSFDRVFMADPDVRDVLAKADLKNRKLFKLNNPFLPAKTPLERSELWLDATRL